MSLRTIELLAGQVLAIVTLRDVFDTVVVPGGSKATLRVARRCVALLLPLWKHLRHRAGISTTFAPMILVLSFVIWMGLLSLAFGMMAHALSTSFDPPLRSFSQAVYLVGSGLVTVGLSETDALGGARWVVLGSGFCGLAVMTMAVTYLLVVQSSLAGRDTGILKLMTAAGNPPSALRLLERHAAIENVSGISRVLDDGRDWCASVQQSHAAHPSLIYFRSVGTGAGWPAALGALLDLALIVEHLLDFREARGCAALMREEGARMASELVTLLKLPPAAPAKALEGANGLKSRLMAAGYAIRQDADLEAFLRARQEHAVLVSALADHLGLPAASLD
ncbi:hypothetical protein WG901_08410 [Novosphingobium sp. PS1R-30]|uniref:Potassium channel domain-containing protein n=1 Tax=Novosphingobium anseongense TaxID=3133436 RepID=A0ABU8RV49_9SPHN